MRRATLNLGVKMGDDERCGEEDALHSALMSGKLDTECSDVSGAEESGTLSGLQAPITAETKRFDHIWRGKEGKKMKKVCVFLADGFEEIEGLTVVDILRRAGVETEMVSIMGRKEIQGAHGIVVEADSLFEEASMAEADLLVLPGGMPGTLHLKAHEGLRKMLCNFDREGKPIAAICAAPSILSGLGMLKGRKACAYPSFEEELDCAQVLREPVVTDGHITTGRGMGAAIPFALKLTVLLCGEKKAEEIREAIVYAV